MSKNNQKNKKLRREVEVLRAQLKGQEINKTTNTQNTKTKPSKPSHSSVKDFGDVQTKNSSTKSSFSYVRRDLQRSLLITTGILLTIGALTATQPHWPQISSQIVSGLPF